MGKEVDNQRQLPGSEHLARRLFRLFSRGDYEIVSRSRIGKSKNVWGLHDDINGRLLVRRGLPQDEARRTLIHEGIHALFPADDNPYATEEAVEEAALRVDNHIGRRRKKKFESFLPD